MTSRSPSAVRALVAASAAAFSAGPFHRARADAAAPGGVVAVISLFLGNICAVLLLFAPVRGVTGMTLYVV